MTPVEEAAKEGYSQEEVQSYLSQKSQEAKAAGYSDEEIHAYIKDNVTQQPDFNQTPVASQGHANLAKQPKSPTTLMEAIETGWGWSNLALGREMLKGTEGELPQMQVNEETPWYLRGAANLTTTALDIPSMIAGGAIGGGPISPITAMGGAFALPMGLRKVFIDAITDRQIGTRKDFADRVTGTLWETAKGWITGAATAGVGKVASVTASALPGAAKAILPTAAELATLTEVSARLEGHAPEPKAFVDNAIVLGVAKAVLPSWAAAPKRHVLTDIYEQTGIPPQHVTGDAIKGNQGVWQDVLDGGIPEAYKQGIEDKLSAPTQNQCTPTATSDTPLTPEQQAQAKAFLEQPFAEIPQAPNEPSRPTHMNYNYIDTPEQMQQAQAQLSILYEEKIKAQQGSPKSWAKSHIEASNALADLLGSDPATVTSFLKGQSPGPSITAQVLARKELALRFTEDLMRGRAALMAKGEQATPEDLASFLAQVERVSTVRAGFLGQRADLARAFNALKSTQRHLERSQNIIDAVNSYGGEKNVQKLAEMLGEYDNPTQAIKFAHDATKATTWEMVVEAWKAGLVSGLRTNEVNFLSTAAFTGLRLPTEAIASVYSLMSKADDRVVMAEIPARILGMTAGVRDGFKAAGAVLRTGDNITGPKTDTYEPKIPGKTGEVVRLPFRFMSASDVLLKTVNERGELYALATKQATLEGQPFGSQAFFGRVADLVAHPTDEMTTAAKDAADRYTFNKPLGPGGKAFQRTVKEWHLEWMFPFITTPGNIFKETARMTPGMNLAVKEWRADYEAGGGRRAKALAEVTVGASIMAAVVSAFQNGVITGNGQPDKKMRATDRAAGWKPYAVKINGQYIDGYLRMAPIGPLIGLTVDGAEFASYMTGEERDQWARMLAFAFASNVTNQTFMTGATNFINVLQDPSRYGQNYFESLASSVVPAIVGQTAADLDPLLREIHGVHDAMIARIPGQREGLIPKKDWTGTPIPNPERLWWGSPFTTTPISTDKVRTEASRLGFATPDIPRTIDVIPGKAFGKLDQVPLTPAQRDVFATQSGQMAYQILQGIVNGPGWDQQPAMIQRQTYEKVMKKSRDMAQMQMLADEDQAVIKQAIENVRRELETTR
jgi:hypothetical protein